MEVLLDRKAYSVVFVANFRFSVIKMCVFLFLFPICAIFASKMDLNEEIERQAMYFAEDRGFSVGRGKRGFSKLNTDLVFPYVIMPLCTSGSARGLYDMQLLEQRKNCMDLFMPGHVLHPLEYSDDYSFAWFVISPKLLDEVLSNEDKERFDKMPMCQLTDEQVEKLMKVIDQLVYISNFTEEEMPRRHMMLKAQLLIGYELLVHYRRVQDPGWKDSQTAVLFSRFCDLVVENYTKSRNVNYYADLLGYDARYFSKVFRTLSNGISPLEWIGRYVATQAKHVMKTNPKQSIKETAFQLGFPSTANFCRYFKRVTGFTPEEYKKR